MENVTHAPGTFCWVELATSDSAGAKKFYTELLGLWETTDDPIPGGGTYTMIQMEGGNIGGLYELNDEMREAGVPPHWLTYVTVEDASATAKLARELGGRVVRDAFDVMEIGRMAVLQDPFGATFAVWQPKLHHGTHFADARPGSVCWNELATRDEDRCATFYGNLFGWKPETRQHPGSTYTIFNKGGAMKAGMLKMNEEWGDCPPNWMIYVSVADCDATAAKVAGLGGKLLVPPTDIPPVGRFSVIQDPQGAVFSIIKLSPPA
jgi:predicted enzyme related to lactoylglutathione lyase